MKKQADELNEEEREEFSNYFYEEFWPDIEEDYENNYLWGCPWDWGPSMILQGETIREMVSNFYKECEKEILDLLQKERALEDSRY